MHQPGVTMPLRRMNLLYWHSNLFRFSPQTAEATATAVAEASAKVEVEGKGEACASAAATAR